MLVISKHNKYLLFLLSFGLQNAGGSLNIAVDEKKSLFRPRHKEVPVQPIKKPYEPKLSYENDICFHKTSNLSNTPWDKCKMSFVPPNVTLVSPPLDNITIGDDVHYRIESNKLEIPRDGCVSGGNFWFAVFFVLLICSYTYKNKYLFK